MHVAHLLAVAALSMSEEQLDESPVTDAAGKGTSTQPDTSGSGDLRKGVPVGPLNSHLLPAAGTDQPQ